jgi:hypothetical protein
MIRRWTAGLLAIGLWTTSAWSAVIHVDDDAPGDPGPGDPLVSDPLEDGSEAHPFDAIQKALAVTLPGDEIVVADGTYTGPGNKFLNFYGKAVTLRSASGDPATCVIDCEFSGRALDFHSGETGATVVDGFTIRNGVVTSSGGGVYCVNSSPTLRNCVIRNHWAASYGGGVYISGQSSRPTLIDCVILNCVANIGGGLYGDSGSRATLTDCTIQGNSAASGGGVYLRSVGRVLLLRCLIVANFASGGGGGMFCYASSSPDLVNCIVAANSTNQSGGGLLCHSACSPTVLNSVFVANRATNDGGAVMCRLASHPTLVNCTITRNDSALAGGLSCTGNSSPSLRNCIIWENSAVGIYFNSGEPTVEYCSVWAGWGGDGNIDADPLFARPPDPGDDAQWGTDDDDYGDLRLTAGSLCIDAGDNADPPRDVYDLDGDGCYTEPLPIDLTGNARYADDPATPDTGRGAAPLVDIGAYEFNSAAPPEPDGRCTGDVNCDGVVNLVDVNPFVLLLSNYPAWVASFDGCDPRNGDLNNDGTYGQWAFDDIRPFVEMLSNQ